MMYLDRQNRSLSGVYFSFNVEILNILVNNIKERRMIKMGFSINEVQTILKEVGLDIKLKKPKSISTRWDIYKIYAPYKEDNEELAELLHTAGQGLGTQSFVAEKEGLYQTLFSEKERAAFEKIMAENTK